MGQADIKTLLYKQQHGTEQERYEADQILDAASEQDWWKAEDHDTQWIEEVSGEHIR